MNEETNAGAPLPISVGEDARGAATRRRARPLPKPLAAVEVALRDSEARYRQLVESLPVAFYATDGQGRLTLYNEAAVTFWGRAPTIGDDRWCGSLKMYALDGSPMPLDECPMALTIREGAHLQGTEAIVERPDGTRRNVLVYPQVFKDAAGRVHGAVNAMVDITERKAVEAALAAAKDDLARQVEELTHLHARVSDADQRKDVFLATLAHELRNPLTPIRNAMHVIRLAGDNRAAVAQTRGMVERQLSQLVRLVDDLLDVSRISRSKIELRKERVELQAIVRQAIETSSALVDHYGHRLELSMPAAPLYVIADPARIAQVFSNLLNNAAKYTPARRPHPRRTCLRTTRASPCRCGTTASACRPRCCAACSRCSRRSTPALDKSRGGLGVGLAIVKRLVEMHGGRVDAKSDGPEYGQRVHRHAAERRARGRFAAVARAGAAAAAPRCGGRHAPHPGRRR